MIWCSLKSWEKKRHWLARTAEKDSQCKYFSCICRSTLQFHLYFCRKKANPLAYSIRSSAQCRLFSAQLSSLSLTPSVWYAVCVDNIDSILYRKKSTKEPNNLVDDSIDLSINHFLEIERTYFASSSSSSSAFFLRGKNPCKIQKSTTLLLYVMLKYLKHAIANHIRYTQTTQKYVCPYVNIKYECRYRYGCVAGWLGVCVCIWIDVILFVTKRKHIFYLLLDIHGISASFIALYSEKCRYDLKSSILIES